MQSNILNKYAHPSKPEKIYKPSSLENRSSRAKIEHYAEHYTLKNNSQRYMKQQLSCIIFNKKKIVSKGYNFHSFGKTHTCSCHAEMNAIYKHMKTLGMWKNFQFLLETSYKSTPVFHKLKGIDTIKIKLEEFSKKSPQKLKDKIKEKKRKYKMYIYRFLSDGEKSTAKPCSECSRWIYLSSMLGINYDIYYTDSKGELTEFDYDCTHYVPKHTYFSNNVYYF
jgi:pyrimidine deaminase RibD-like protein